MKNCSFLSFLFIINSKNCFTREDTWIDIYKICQLRSIFRHPYPTLLVGRSSRNRILTQITFQKCLAFKKKVLYTVLLRAYNQNNILRNINLLGVQGCFSFWMCRTLQTGGNWPTAIQTITILRVNNSIREKTGIYPHHSTLQKFFLIIDFKSVKMFLILGVIHKLRWQDF